MMDTACAYRATRLAPVDTATTLPPGVVGRLQGVALTYDVLDDKGTTFARGSLTRTMRERVAAGKVKLYWNHGDAHVTGSYDTDLHIGIVRRMWDEQRGGAWVAMMEADLFDTEEGRRAHEYLRAVHDAGAETGLSIGMMPDTVRGERATLDGVACIRVTETGLREISVVSEASVPGTAVTHVRAEAHEMDDMRAMAPEIGMRVQVKAGMAHDEMTKNAVGTIAEISTPALGVKFDGMRKVHRWYVASELDAATDDARAMREASAPELCGDSGDIDYTPLLRTIAAHVGADAFRAMSGAVLGDATDPSDSDAASGDPAPTDSDAAPVDSPADATPAATTYASYGERLLVMRRLYSELP